jgi:hypothetical protein
MSWAGEHNALEDLRDMWTRWTSFVELFARRRRTRLRVDAQAYGTAHTEVVEACRTLASMVEGEEQAYFQGLEKLAGPWVSPQSFRLPEREILSDLLRQCRKVQRELGGRHLVLPDLRTPLRLLLSLTAFAAFMLCFWTAGSAWSPILQQGRSWKEAYHMCVDRTRYVHHILIPGMIVVSVSSVMVWKSAKV